MYHPANPLISENFCKTIDTLWSCLLMIEVLWQLLRYINLLTYLLTYQLFTVIFREALHSRSVYGTNTPCWHQMSHRAYTVYYCLSCKTGYFSVMESQDLVSRLSRDMVFHVSVLAESWHLAVSRVSMSCYVSWFMTVSWLCLCQA